MSNGRRSPVRPALLYVLIAWLGLSLAPAPVASATGRGSTSRPNIVLIMADDVGVEGFGCYGGLSYATPNIDSLAAQGARFTHAFAQPLCTPSRVQIMTGRYNWRNYESFRWLNPLQRTFAQALREKGYATAVVGKWQLSEPNPVNFPNPGGLPVKPNITPDVIRDMYGFDEYLLWQLNGLGSRYWAPELEQNGVLLSTTLDEYGPDMFVDYAIDFMTRQRDAGREFLLYYPMVLPHDPWVATPLSPPGTSKTVSSNANFADNVEYIDALVGRIVGAVDSLGLAEDTVVLFCSDNGTHWNITSQTTGGPVTGDKSGHTDRATHVPLVARWTGSIAPAQTSDLMVDFSDVYPTLASLAGAVVESGDVAGAPFLNRDGSLPTDGRDAVYFWYEPLHGSKVPFIAARSHQYKLYPDGRFYDLQTSPDETPGTEIPPGSGSPAVEAERARLQEVLDSLGREHTLGEEDGIVPGTVAGSVGDSDGDEIGETVTGEFLLGDGAAGTTEYRLVVEFDLSAPEVVAKLQAGHQARLRLTVTGSVGTMTSNLAVYALEAGEDGTIQPADYHASASLQRVLTDLQLGETIDVPITAAALEDAGGWSGFRLQALDPAEYPVGGADDQLRFGFDDGLDFGDGMGPNTTARIVLLEAPSGPGRAHAHATDYFSLELDTALDGTGYSCKVLGTSTAAGATTTSYAVDDRLFPNWSFPKWIHHTTNDAAGLRVHATSDSSGLAQYDPPVEMLGAVFRVGDTILNTYPSHPGGAIELEYQVLSLEDEIEVWGQTFLDCVRVSETVRVNSIVTGYQEAWLARGLGAVKVIDHTGGGGWLFASESELVGYASQPDSFDAYCHGDPSGLPCPCLNVGTDGDGCANSGSVGARLSASLPGGTSLDAFTFFVTDLPPGQGALLFTGANPINGGLGVPFSSGLRCVGGGILRRGVKISGPGGVASWGPGLAAAWNVLPGETIHGQVWYRDPLTPCSSGKGSNLTNALTGTLTN